VVDAVVFDLDGVLVDSEPVWEEVRRGLVEEYGGHWAEDAQSRLMGMTTGEWARYLSDELGVDLPPERVAELVIDRVEERLTRDPPLMPGAPDAVRRLADRWPLGLASSSPRRLIDAVLAASGLAGAFLVTVSTEEVPRGKPAPDVYLAVVEVSRSCLRRAWPSRTRPMDCGPRWRPGCMPSLCRSPGIRWIRPFCGGRLP